MEFSLIQSSINIVIKSVPWFAGLCTLCKLCCPGHSMHCLGHWTPSVRGTRHLLSGAIDAYCPGHSTPAVPGTRHLLSGALVTCSPGNWTPAVRGTKHLLSGAFYTCCPGHLTSSEIYVIKLCLYTKPPHGERCSCMLTHPFFKRW